MVDIPIGFSEGCKERECDLKARKKLGSRSSTVFRAPARQAVEFASRNKNDNEGIKNINKQICGKSLSNQLLAILPKIVQVDSEMADRRAGILPVIREIHPEICFWAINNRQTLLTKKNEKRGIDERIRALKAVEPRVEQIFEEGCCKYYRKDVTRDDILDALAAAVTAYRGHEHLQTLPENPPSDSKGLPMEMVYRIP